MIGLWIVGGVIVWVIFDYKVLIEYGWCVVGEFCKGDRVV